MMVLVGAVITAFVGFTGLTHRMAVDRCLPQVLLQVNERRHTRHWIIFLFWVMTSFLVVMTWGEPIVGYKLSHLRLLNRMRMFFPKKTRKKI